jgi:hypothetical protein
MHCGVASIQNQVGGAMSQPKQPTKQDVRDWLKHEVNKHRPPPDPQQIRRELGWGLLHKDHVFGTERND